MKKFFTLTMLLLCAVVGVKAADVLCSARVPAGQEGTFSNTDGITTGQTGCTLKYSGLQGGNNIVTVSGVDYYKFGSNTAYVQLILNSGSFQAGDILTATVTSNGGSNAKTVDVKVGSTSTSTVDVKGTETKNITYTLKAADIESDGSIKIYRNTNGSNLRAAVFSVSGTRASTACTVTFIAGSNGSCGTTSLTESSAGAGVILPAVTANANYTFNGWFTAATGGTKVGDAGAKYNPTGNITLYAQYTANVASGISINNYNPSTYRDNAITLTATATGAPSPTVTWYQNTTASTTGGIEKGTGNTYNPDVTTPGTYYFYAIASNGISPDATSSLVTLTVINQDIVVSGNNFYIAENDLAIPQQNIICDDITMQYSNGSYSAATKDETVKSIVSSFVASVNSSTNGWDVTFTPSKYGILKVGVVINKDKKFSISNVTSFNYQTKNPDGSGSISSNEWTPSEKKYAVITIDVKSGTSYKFSVSGSKMGFYGFEFTPTTSTTVTIDNGKGYRTFASKFPTNWATVENVTAYRAEVSGTTVSFKKVTGAVPAGEGLLLKGDDNTYTIPVVSSAAAIDNVLIGVTKETTVNESGIFVLMAPTSSPIGFYKTTAASFTVGANTAYLPASVAGARMFIGFDDEEEVTGIRELNSSANKGAIYNMNGVRVEKAQKGIFIKNGKKFVVK